jgi:hypothetical protein
MRYNDILLQQLQALLYVNDTATNNITATLDMELSLLGITANPDGTKSLSEKSVMHIEKYLIIVQ